MIHTKVEKHQTRWELNITTDTLSYVSLTHDNGRIWASIDVRTSQKNILVALRDMLNDCIGELPDQVDPPYFPTPEKTSSKN